MKSRLLIIIAIIVVSIVWSRLFQLNAANEVIVDGISISALIVTLIVPPFSVASWVLLSWADHRKFIFRNIPASALLGIIVITPISGIAGPMLAVILGVIVGSSLFAFEFWRKRK